MKTPKRYLVPWDFMADPSVHVWDGRLYIYPSHDWEPEDFVENDNGRKIKVILVLYCGNFREMEKIKMKLHNFYFQKKFKKSLKNKKNNKTNIK